MMMYSSFEAFVQGFQAMNSESPETQKVHLVIAPTGSGKTTAFIAEMVRKYPDVLQVLCLPRRLACNVSVYLRSQYGLNVAVKHGKVNETVGDLVKPDTQVLIMTYRSVVNMILSMLINILFCRNLLNGRQLSIIFDECHESCYEAVMLYRLISSLFAKKPDWLHSLFCVSATMDRVELSKRLNIEEGVIQVSNIEAPRKTFVVGPKEVIPIKVFEDDEDKAKKPRQKKGKGKDTDDKEDKEDGEKSKPVPNLKKRMQGFARNYNKKFINNVVEDIITAPLRVVNESTVVIVDGVNTGKKIIASLDLSFKRDGVKHVRFWNTFVQEECPVKDEDLSTCHLVIIGSHMKLSSSITFHNCTELHVSDIMQVARQDGRDATVQLFRDLVPNSVLMQCFGRADRNCKTRKRYNLAIFPPDFKITRLEYPKQDDISDFTSNIIDVSVSRTPAKTRAFCTKYGLNIRKAEEIFHSQLPVELLLALHRYAKTDVSEEEKTDFRNSLNVLRALAHTAAYFSDDDHRLVKPTTLSGMSNGTFAQLMGKFVLHLLNKVCGCQPELEDSNWNKILGLSEKSIHIMVQSIKLSINKDGMGFFKYNGIQEQIKPDGIIDAIAFSRKYALELLPFFLKHNPDFMFPTTAADEDDDDQEIDQLKLNGFSMLPYWTLKTVGGVFISPSFILSVGSFPEEKPQQQQYERVDSAKPQPQQPRQQQQQQPRQQQQQQCASGGSAQQQPHRVSGGSAQPQPQRQQPCTRVDSAQKHPQQEKCAGGGSAQKHPQQQQCASGGSAQQQPHRVSGGSAKSKISAK